MSSPVFKFDFSSLEEGMDQLPKKLEAGLDMYLSTKSKELESYMKSNRVWVDRTGLAKATLNASLSKPKPNTSRITLAHGVDYGLWLELANEKNYAIIYPTIKIKGPVVLEGLKNILGKIK